MEVTMCFKMRIVSLRLQLRLRRHKSLAGVEGGCPFCKSFIGCQDALMKMGIPFPDATCEDFQL